jgi:hypothetical protein
LASGNLTTSSGDAVLKGWQADCPAYRRPDEFSSPSCAWPRLSRRGHRWCAPTGDVLKAIRAAEGRSDRNGQQFAQAVPRLLGGCASP